MSLFIRLSFLWWLFSRSESAEDIAWYFGNVFAKASELDDLYRLEIAHEKAKL